MLTQDQKIPANESSDQIAEKAPDNKSLLFIGSAALLVGLLIFTWIGLTQWLWVGLCGILLAICGLFVSCVSISNPKAELFWLNLFLGILLAVCKRPAKYILCGLVSLVS